MPHADRTLPCPRPGILNIDPYKGGETDIPGAKRLIRLSSNEGPYGPSPMAVTAVAAAADSLHRYPDGNCTALRKALGEAHHINPDQIVCGAGSDEILSLLCRAYAGSGDEVLYSEHGFVMYGINAHAAGATPVTAPEKDLNADVDALLARVTDKTRLVLLANPNNPTGRYLPQDEVARLAAGLPSSVLLVIDAAYAEYVTEPDYSAGHELVDQYPNVVVTRTFSKIYALGGLRLGWVHASPVVTDILNRVRSPFNVSSAAQMAGIASLHDTDFVLNCRNANVANRKWFCEAVTRLGFTVHPSVTNFVLLEIGDRAEECRKFLQQNGIFVRSMASYGLSHCLRVTIGMENDMRTLVQNLACWLGR